MTLLRKLLLLILLLGLNSCTVGPEYKPSELGAPEKFVLQEALNKLKNNDRERNNPQLSLNWWQGFPDPVLNELVNTGIENNYRIAAASARVKEARELLKLAGSQDALSAVASIDSNAGGEFDISDVSTDGNYNLSGSLGLVLPLDIFGSITRQEQAALARIEGRYAELQGTILDVSSDITGQYLRLRGNQRQLALLEESVELQEKTLSIVNSRYNAGLSPELDVRRAEASVENLRADIPRLRESLINSRNLIATLTGRYPGAYEDLLSKFKEIPEYSSSVPQVIPADVLSLRPDVRQAEAELKQAVAEVGVATAEFYPFFQLVGQISIGASGINGDSLMNLLIGSIGALIEQVVADGGARRANLNIAKSRTDLSLANYRQTLLDAMNEVEITLSSLESSFERQESLKKAVAASERSFHQAEILYTQGLTSFLDVVDAQRVLASAQQDLASAKTEYAFQIANLFRVLGTKINSE
ncbi:MAG: efflux transporter outer membrane subunit [Thermodesulfobacteriota bacterium]